MNLTYNFRSLIQMNSNHLNGVNPVSKAESSPLDPQFSIINIIADNVLRLSAFFMSLNKQ